MRAIDVYYASVVVSSVISYVDKRARPMIESAVHSATHHDSIHELAKLTAIVDGKRRIVDRPPVVVHRADATNPLVDGGDGDVPGLAPGGPPRPCWTATRSSTTR